MRFTTRTVFRVLVVTSSSEYHQPPSVRCIERVSSAVFWFGISFVFQMIRYIMLIILKTLSLDPTFIKLNRV